MLMRIVNNRWYKRSLNVLGFVLWLWNGLICASGSASWLTWAAFVYLSAVLGWELGKWLKQLHLVFDVTRCCIRSFYLVPSFHYWQPSEIRGCWLGLDWFIAWR